MSVIKPLRAGTSRSWRGGWMNTVKFYDFVMCKRCPENVRPRAHSFPTHNDIEHSAHA